MPTLVVVQKRRYYISPSLQSSAVICLDADLFLPLKAKFEAPSFKPPPYGKNFAATQARRDIYKEVSERVVAIAEHEDPFIGEDKMKIVWTECAEEYSRRAGLESANTQLITTEKEDLQKVDAHNLQKVDAHISKYDIASDISKLIKRQKGSPFSTQSTKRSRRSEISLSELISFVL